MSMSSKIYQEVMEAIQTAEEIDGGLTAKEYIKLMETIGEECYHRANICRAIEGRDHE